MSMGRFLVASRFSDPVAGEGELILEVLAAALKPLDKAIAAGSHYASPRKLPVVCGLDGSRTDPPCGDRDCVEKARTARTKTGDHAVGVFRRLPMVEAVSTRRLAISLGATR